MILAGFCFLVLAAAMSPAGALDVLGNKPLHVSGSQGSIVNDQAVEKAVWAPGIDDGYVPQGLTVADGYVLLSGYQSTDPKVDKGPCRVFRIDAMTGGFAGQFDLPEDCGHAGGLVYIGKGNLVVSDTRRLYMIDMKKAFQGGDISKTLRSFVKLGGGLKGSLIDFDGKSIFIGSSEKDSAKAKGFFLPLSIFETHDGKTVREDIALRSFPIGAEAQGAAFDLLGNLWMTFSSSKYGRLKRLDPETGKVLAEYDMVIGIEDIGFDGDGKLWSVSEAGSLRWSRWSVTFPVLFRIDVKKLN